MKIGKVSLVYAGVRIEALKCLFAFDRVSNIRIFTFKGTKLANFISSVRSLPKVKEYYIVESKKGVALEKLADFWAKQKPDVLLSVGFPYIIAPSLVQEMRNRSMLLNLHPHILPKWKGKNAIKISYEQGETTYGATLHYLTEEVDAGEIIAQYAFSLPQPALHWIYELTFSIVEPIVLSEGLKKLFTA